MGKESLEIQKTLKAIGNLDYVEVRHVPMKRYPGYGDSVDAQVQKDIEQMVAREIILQRLPVRGIEVEYFRGIFAMSQRDFAKRLGMSHVTILKWEKAQTKPLDLVNEVAVKVLMAGMLGLKVPASLDTLTGLGPTPKKLTLDYVPRSEKPRKRAA